MKSKKGSKSKNKTKRKLSPYLSFIHGHTDDGKRLRNQLLKAFKPKLPNLQV